MRKNLIAAGWAVPVVFCAFFFGGAFFEMAGMPAGGVPESAALAVIVLPDDMDDEAEEKDSHIGIFPPVDRMALKDINDARKLVDLERYADAVQLISAILDMPEDYYFQEKTGGSVYRSLKSEAQQLLMKMPARGRQIYELQAGPTARQALQAAVASGKRDQLGMVARKYFHTEAGYEAAFLLGLDHLDHNHAISAALSFQKLYDIPEARKKFDPVLTLLLAVSWNAAGMKERADILFESLSRLEKSAELEKLTIGGKSLSQRPATEELSAWLQKQLPVLEVFVPRGMRQWSVMRGDLQRNATSEAGSSILTLRWRVPTTDNPEAWALVELLRRNRTESGQPDIPQLFPLVVGETVLMRTAWNLTAVNLLSGKRLWDVPTGDYADTMARLENAITRAESSGNSGQNAASQKYEMMAGILNSRIWNSGAYGSLASNGKYVYCVEDIINAQNLDNYSGNINLVRGGFGGRRMDDGSEASGPAFPNRLCAYDIQTGKLVWHVGGSTQRWKLAEANTMFLGPPTPIGKELYVLAQQKNEIVMLALDQETGRTLWSLVVCMAPEISVSPYLPTLSPSYSEGILVCPTPNNALVAVDIATHAVLWAHAYAESMGRNNYRMYSYQGNVSGTIDTSVVIADGNVLYLPVDQNYVYCIRLVDGELVWKLPSSGALYIAGVYQGRAYLATTAGMNAVELAPVKVEKKETPEDPKPADEEGDDDEGFDDDDDVFVPAVPGRGMVVVNGRLVQMTAEPRFAEQRDETIQPVAQRLSLGKVSGMGYRNDRFYYLPLQEGKVAKIDLPTLSVVETVSSREGNIPGNLIPANDRILSQRADHLDAYQQIQTLDAELKRLYAQDARHPDALILDAVHRWDQGDIQNAVALLREAVKSGDFQAKNLLLRALMEGVRENFNNFDSNHEEILKLLSTPEKKLEFQCFVVLGLEKTGRLTEAVRECGRLLGDLRLGAAVRTDGDGVLFMEDPMWSENPDQWVSTQMTEIQKKAEAKNDQQALTALSTLVAAEAQRLSQPVTPAAEKSENAAPESEKSENSVTRATSVTSSVTVSGTELAEAQPVVEIQSAASKTASAGAPIMANPVAEPAAAPVANSVGAPVAVPVADPAAAPVEVQVQVKAVPLPGVKPIPVPDAAPGLPGKKRAGEEAKDETAAPLLTGGNPAFPADVEASQKLSRLHTFIRQFRFRPEVLPVREQFISLLTKKELFSQAEFSLLQQNTGLSGNAEAANWARIVELFAAAPRPLSAAVYYKYVLKRFPAVPCFQGKTPPQWLASLPAEHPIHEALKEQQPWAVGRMDVSTPGRETAGEPQNRATSAAFYQQQAITIANTPSLPFQGMTASFQTVAQGRILVIEDAWGQQRWAPNTANDMPTIYAGGNRALRVSGADLMMNNTDALTSGHLLFLGTATGDVFAVDFLTAPPRVVWRWSPPRQQLDVKDPAIIPIIRRLENMGISSLSRERNRYSNITASSASVLRGVNEVGLCFTQANRIYCLDIFTGEVLWERMLTGAAGSQTSITWAMGDSRHLYVMASGTPVKPDELAGGANPVININGNVIIQGNVVINGGNLVIGGAAVPVNVPQPESEIKPAESADAEKSPENATPPERYLIKNVTLAEIYNPPAESAAQTPEQKARRQALEMFRELAKPGDAPQQIQVFDITTGRELPSRQFPNLQHYIHNTTQLDSKLFHNMGRHIGLYDPITERFDWILVLSDHREVATWSNAVLEKEKLVLLSPDFRMHVRDIRTGDEIFTTEPLLPKVSPESTTPDKRYPAPDRVESVNFYPDGDGGYLVLFSCKANERPKEEVEEKEEKADDADKKDEDAAPKTEEEKKAVAEKKRKELEEKQKAEQEKMRKEMLRREKTIYIQQLGWMASRQCRHGMLMHLDAKGKSVWDEPIFMARSFYLPDLPAKLPVVCFGHTKRQRSATTVIKVFDKRSGRMLYDGELSAISTPMFKVVGDPKTNTVTFDFSNNMKLELACTDAPWGDFLPTRERPDADGSVRNERQTLKEMEAHAVTLRENILRAEAELAKQEQIAKENPSTAEEPQLDPVLDPVLKKPGQPGDNLPPPAPMTAEKIKELKEQVAQYEDRINKMREKLKKTSEDEDEDNAIYTDDWL